MLTFLSNTSSLLLACALVTAGCGSSDALTDPDPNNPNDPGTPGGPNPPPSLPRRTDLGTFGGASSYAYDVNDGGTVVGAAQTADGRFRAFRWTSADGLQELAPLAGDVESRAISVSTDGVALGISVSATGDARPVTWSTGGDAVELPIAPIAGADLVPSDRNAQGAVAGDALFAEDESNLVHAWVWSAAGGMVDLSNELDVPFENYAAAINDAGTVVGTTGGGLWRAFRRTGPGGAESIGVPGSEPDRTELTALGINGDGAIVGWTRLAADEGGAQPSAPFPGVGTFPYVWRAASGFTLLPVFETPSESNAVADDVNGRGDVVGSAVTPDGTIQAAAWPRGGPIVNLNDTDANPSVALAVNSTGVAVGWTSTDGGEGTNRGTVWNLDQASAVVAREGRAPGTTRPALSTRVSTGAQACLRRRDVLVSKAKLAACFEQGGTLPPRR
jgi:probable HAF family extracellular repeat protein